MVPWVTRTTCFDSESLGHQLGGSNSAGIGGTGAPTKWTWGGRSDRGYSKPRGQSWMCRYGERPNSRPRIGDRGKTEFGTDLSRRLRHRSEHRGSADGVEAPCCADGPPSRPVAPTPSRRGRRPCSGRRGTYRRGSRSAVHPSRAATRRHRRRCGRRTRRRAHRRGAPSERVGGRGGVARRSRSMSNWFCFRPLSSARPGKAASRSL